MPKMLFLGYDRTSTSLIARIESMDWEVEHTSAPVLDFSEYDLVVSFGYRHIIRKNVLATARRPPLNLHISYLPWNRGAHPLFWAAHDGTPIGVSIHEIDTGIDTGPIVYQKEVFIDLLEATFSSGHEALVEAVETLFTNHLEALLGGDYLATEQQGVGTIKRVSDLPSGFSWDNKIHETLNRIKLHEI